MYESAFVFTSAYFKVSCDGTLELKNSAKRASAHWLRFQSFPNAVFLLQCVKPEV